MTNFPIPDDSSLTLNKDPEGLLQKLNTFILDLDGTVYLGNQLIPGSLEFNKQVKEKGGQIFYLTNNSSKSKRSYLAKLQSMGIPVSSEGEIISSLDVAIDYLTTDGSFSSVYVFGNEKVRLECARHGVQFEQEKPDCVLLTYHNDFTYRECAELCKWIREDIPYIATHPDINCPTEDGFIPDIGAMIAFVLKATGRSPDLILGKPNAPIVDYALRKAGRAAEETALIGDRLYTDIKAAVNNGLCGIFVLSGEGTWADMNKYQTYPHLVFSSLQEIVPFIR